VTETKKIDPFDVEALEESLNDSATRVSAIWVSYLLYTFYLFIAAGSVDHRQLLVEDPIKVPAFAFDLPIFGFFFAAPILFVIFHLFVMLQVVMLGRTAAAYNEAVDQAVPSPKWNALIRQRLANTFFAQIFAGSPNEREGPLGALLKFIAWTTVAIAPLLLLLVFQFKFLPYHSHLVTWTHRALILIELIMLIFLWPLVLEATKDIDSRRLVRVPVSYGAVAIYIFVSILLGTFPGEPHFNLLTGYPPLSVRCTRWLPANFDRLHLANVDFVADDRLAEIEKHTSDRRLLPSQGERTRNFRNRDLNCSDLTSADLRRVDLTSASLVGATLNSTVLDGSSLDNAQLQGASLSGAHLRAASLRGAHLQSATMNGADLEGASLGKADLQGALLNGAHLQGAILNVAELQGTAFNDAEMQGASFDSAQLQGASLNRAAIQGAWFYRANLQGASFNATSLQGSAFDDADLQGVSLADTAFQGTSLIGADLGLARMTGVRVWRAQNADCMSAQVSNHSSDAVIELKETSRGREPVEATPEEIAKFIDRENSTIPDAYGAKALAIERLRAGLVADPANHETTKAAEVWNNCERAAQGEAQASFDSERAVFLRDLACNTRDDRHAVVGGIINNWISEDQDRRTFSAMLARGLLSQDGKKCAATDDLDTKTRRKLVAAVAAAASTPPAAIAAPQDLPSK
jgi:uncharacterized protein YjbI with pentapeptide repeats